MLYYNSLKLGLSNQEKPKCRTITTKNEGPLTVLTLIENSRAAYHVSQISMKIGLIPDAAQNVGLNHLYDFGLPVNNEQNKLKVKAGATVFK